MPRTKGSKNKIIKEGLEKAKPFIDAVTDIAKGKPVEMKLNMEDLKKEKPTESKTIADQEKEVADVDSQDITVIPGIGPKTAEKLKELGYTTLIAIATGRADEIAQEMKIGYPQAKVWVQYAQEKVLAKMVLKTAEEHDKEKKAKQIFLKTGSEAFNTMTGGGIPTMSISGSVGRLATGKTQIGFDLIVDCLGRLKEKAVFIEPEPDTFHLDRLKQIAKLKGYTCNWADLYVCEASQIPTAKAQYLQYKVVQKALEKGEKIRLIVVDSFNAKFRAGWSRTEMLPIRTREFGEHFTLIEYLAARYNTAWYLTFQAIAPPRPDQGLAARVKFAGEYYPVGGDYVLHSVNNWIALNQVKTELWEATLFDSSHVQRGSCNFILTAKGLMDGIK
jgi:DNA repair protein RadA